MLFPIGRLIEGRGKPLCVRQDTKLSDALAQMVEHDYSQLPLVDAKNSLTGIISENSIVSTYYHIGGSVLLLDLTVDHCQTPAVTLGRDDDIFEALARLETHYAVVIVEDGKPVGIVTNYDTTRFFRDLSEGLILVEDIEVMLRQYAEAAFPDGRAMTTALKRAFATRSGDADAPAQEYDRLTFYQQMQLIRHPANWPSFHGVFEPLDLFWSLMDHVREIRNQLAHFRGRLEPVQRHALVRARDWLAARPDLPSTTGGAEEALRVTVADSPVSKVEIRDTLAYRPVSRYRQLEVWLWQQRPQANAIRTSFDDIVEIIGSPLPPSAREHRSWWANDPSSNTQCLAWMAAGWKVDDVDLGTGEVVFRQTNTVIMQLFFADLLERLKAARPGITRATKTLPQSWWSWGGGKTGFSFMWSLTGSNALHVELYIDTGDKAENKTAFDRLREQREIIESDFGGPLKWERLENRKASRIVVSRPHTRITAAPEELERAKQWAIETTLPFVDALRPRVQEL